MYKRKYYYPSQVSGLYDQRRVLGGISLLLRQRLHDRASDCGGWGQHISLIQQASEKSLICVVVIDRLAQFSCSWIVLVLGGISRSRFTDTITILAFSSRRQRFRWLYFAYG